MGKVVVCAVLLVLTLPFLAETQIGRHLLLPESNRQLDVGNRLTIQDDGRVRIAAYALLQQGNARYDGGLSLNTDV